MQRAGPRRPDRGPVASVFTSDDATARQTLIDLHYYALQHPEIPLIGMHDAALQEQYMRSEKFTQAMTK